MNIPKLIEDEKRYFGTYSVMALFNAQTILDHIQKIAGIEDSDAKEKNPENLWEHPVMCCLNDSNSHPEKTMFVMEKLQTYFPFLKIMGDNQRVYRNETSERKRLEVNNRDLYEVLNQIFRVLKKYRDLTTHFMIEDPCLDANSNFLRFNEQPLATMINKYYNVALRNVKEKYSYKTEDLAFIQDKRYRRVKNTENKRKMEVNVDFFLSMVAYNDDTAKKLHLSGMGVALLICLFLDKQYINLFVSKLPACSKFGIEAEKCRIIIRSMGIHSIKQPKDRIQSEKDKTSLAMDMLNELKRCPNELFSTLSAEDRTRFRTVSSDYNEVLQKRSSDRFAQLLLQYIDYGKLFSDIRFHINMGKLRYLFNAAKNCIDGETRVRVLEHPLNCFGRIAEMENLRKNDDCTFADTGIRIRGFEDMKRDDADPEGYPYIVDTCSHYILENNKVEMSLGRNYVLPTIKEENGKWYVCKETPACRMSILELPAMAFHLYLLGSKKTEDRIKHVYGKYRRLFDDMCDGKVNRNNIADYGIAECDLPQKVLDCLDGCAHGKDVELFIRNTVDELRTDTDRRLERLQEDKNAVLSKDNKMGKRNFRQIRTGVIANFLAEDIVKFQPTKSDRTDKLTGLNYRVLQASIATYDSAGDRNAQESFKLLFEKAGLMGAAPDRCHPFIQNVFARVIPENTIEFYERYLVERKNYLDKLLKKICKGTKINVPFVNRNQSRWKDSTQEYLGNVYGRNLAIELPRQMFDSDIKEHLRKLPQMADVDFENANVTYLIGEYIKRVLNDDFQDFYSWKRNYRYMDMLKRNFDTKDAICYFMSTEERERLWENRKTYIENYRSIVLNRNRCSRRAAQDDMESGLDRQISILCNDYKKNEKLIRRYKIQDALLFMMAKKTLTSMADFDGKKFNLKDIMPDADKGILSEIMPMIFKFKKNGKEYTITSEGMKLKNYGDFFVLANDKRLGNLMKLVGADTVSKEKLTEELKNYDQCRPEVVRLVFDLEKWAIDTYPKVKEIVMSTEKGQFYKILEVLCENQKVNPQQSHILRKIRNAFEHNNYPEKGIVEITTLPEIAQNMKKVFGEYAEIKNDA